MRNFRPASVLACAAALVLILFSSLSLTACGGAAGSPGPASSASPSSPTPSSTTPAGTLLPNAQWLYAAPSGSGQDISSLNLMLGLNTHSGGFDYPVQYADGSHGHLTFTDGSTTLDVPIPAEGFQPSVGGWGANDGHLVVVDESTREYYDFWKLTLDAQGNPNTTVGSLRKGSLDGDGTPGTTAANITGLAGVILPGEIESGHIAHALNCIIPGPLNNSGVGHQIPAGKTDGTAAGPLSEGGKIGIDPSVNIDGLAVGKDTKTILKALQQYGCAVTDQTDAVGVNIYTALPSTSGLDLSGLTSVGQYLRFYM